MLYHYTSIATLALILKGRKIRFNNLLNVDDPYEMETADMGNFGKHCLISCWTKNVEDVLPMWNMYTPDMRGVRIGMREFPFKKYTYPRGYCGLEKRAETYINLKKIYDDGKAAISIRSPELIEVEYTDDENKLKPQIKHKHIETSSESISLHGIGRYKKSYWEFQKEWRYKIIAFPYSLKMLQGIRTEKEMIVLWDEICNTEKEQSYDELYLDLADDAFENMEILLGPKTSEAEEIIIRSLVNQYCPNDNVSIKKSQIRIR